MLTSKSGFFGVGSTTVSTTGRGAGVASDMLKNCERRRVRVEAARFRVSLGDGVLKKPRDWRFLAGSVEDCSGRTMLRLMEPRRLVMRLTESAILVRFEGRSPFSLS